MSGETLAVITGSLTVTGIILGALAKWVIRPLWRLTQTASHFFETWNGEPARDGLPPRPGVVQRLIDIERQIKVNGTGLPLGDAVANLIKRADTNAAGIQELKDGQGVARDAAKKAADLAANVHDELHHWVAEGQLREETYRETLREVHGIDLDPPPRRDPHARTREDDDPQEP